MKKEIIEQLFVSFEDIKEEQSGIEYWSARTLQELLGYTKWENFERVILRAQESAKNSDYAIDDHFLKVRKMIETGKGAQREVIDYSLTRYACYLIAQNGDPSKSQVAFAQTYFAVQTRKQEIIEQRLLDIERVEAREKLSQTEKKLSGVKDLKGQRFISGEHVANNKAVRKILGERGVKPEFLPAGEDVKKVQRKLVSDEKKAAKLQVDRKKKS